MIDRRTILGGLAAAPLIYGLPPVFGRQADDKTPWLAEALKRMADTNRWGVVIVPSGAEESRVTQGRTLYAITELDDEDYDAHDLLVQAVFIALPAEAVRSRYPEAAGATRLLLDPAGKLLTFDKPGLDEYSSPANFAAFFRTFIHGAKGEHLEERANAIEAGLNDELKRALANMDSVDADLRIAAALTLGRNIETITPLVARLQQKGSKQAMLLLRRHFTTLPSESVGRRLPYGTYMLKFGCSCGSYYPELPRVDDLPRIACGMGRVSKRTGKFVSFLPKA